MSESFEAEVGEGVQPARRSVSQIVWGRESGVVPRRRIPTHIIVFSSTTLEDNIQHLTDTLKVQETLTKSREGVVTLDGEDVDEVSLYRALGIATGTLTPAQVQLLESSTPRLAVYENGVRSLPRAPAANWDFEGHRAASLSRTLTTSRSLSASELVAYLNGQRDAIDNMLRLIGADHGRGYGPGSLSVSELSWCLDMIGVTPDTPRGRGIKVAVLDTGVHREHPDLAHHFSEHPENARSFVHGDDDVEDLNGHGTRCCGIVGGLAAPISGLRYGVAPEATLLAGKVLNGDGLGRDDEILEGIAWAMERGADVITMSFGSRGKPDDFSDALYETLAERLNARKILVVAAAGNDSDRSIGHVAPVAYPAARKHFCAVGAVDRNARVASFSCGGPELKLVAPGVDVFSSDCRGLHACKSGTSLSAPHVAGAAAIWAEKSQKRGEDLLNLLIHHARRIAGPPRDVGVGLIAV